MNSDLDGDWSKDSEEVSDKRRDLELDGSIEEDANYGRQGGQVI